MGRRHNFTRSYLKRSFYKSKEDSESNKRNNEDCNSNTTTITDDEQVEELKVKYLYERVGVGFTEEER